MLMVSKERLGGQKIIAEKDGYRLLEKHAVVYLLNWLEVNDTVNFEVQIKCLLTSLKNDFEMSPAHTIWELEKSGKDDYQDLYSFLKHL